MNSIAHNMLTSSVLCLCAFPVNYSGAKYNLHLGSKSPYVISRRRVPGSKGPTYTQAGP